MAHQDLETLYQELFDIHDALLDFKPLVEAPPILDSSSIDSDPNDDGQWLKHENIPGIKHLRESIRMDIDFLSDPKSAQEQPVSTHAPYLVAVFTELLCAPAPVIALFKYMHLVDSSHKRANLKEKKHHRMPSAKVDVVAENGRQWIRINTIKNAALLAEFREMDSYLTDSDDSEQDTSDPDYKPSLAPSEFTNSILKMGQGLLAAAKANPTPEPVRITMRLTRLDPVGEPHDPRIARTIQCLMDMGIAVELGERPMPLPRDLAACRAPPAPRQIRPTRRISLDLSVLVALASDLTHAALPADAQEAAARFKPPTVYRDWKPDVVGGGGGDHASDIQRHVRIITLQALQEMDKPLIEQIHKQLALLPEPVEFWTSDDARERCLRIVTRIGGSSEIRRAEALFSGAESTFWDGSRYAAGFVQLFPIRLYPNPPQLPLEGALLPHPKFFTYMAKVCQDLLEDPVVPKNSKGPRLNAGVLGDSELQPAKINSKLSPNAVKSMLRGAELGWTTLTTTKSSVRALLREVRASRLNGRLPDDRGSSSISSSSSDADVASAVLWVVDPRNLQCFAT
ncbi:unnamed protein product [Mycena citricolor]|uniref:Uncharacterized protein n=1 Tax=Mycena citricolor TaxID=2018698 RepID=A0AAD2HTF0_9AGAR|nr:unnamed protein product [Mycena citricolor]